VLKLFKENAVAAPTAKVFEDGYHDNTSEDDSNLDLIAELEELRRLSVTSYMYQC
jgi:hypothetical protein